MRLFRRQENCLAGITAEELKDAAQQLDAGDQAPADALIARGGTEHGRCVAFTILGLTADAGEEDR